MKTGFLFKMKLLRLALIVSVVQPAFLGLGCSVTSEQSEWDYLLERKSFNNLYNPKTVRTVRGKIFDMKSVEPEENVTLVNLYDNEVAWDNLSFDQLSQSSFLGAKMITSQGDLFFVLMAPNWFLENHNISFQEGETVSITGSLVDMGGSENDVNKEDIKENEPGRYLVAREIKKKGRILAVRSRNGKPLWFRQGILLGDRLFIQSRPKDQRIYNSLGGPMPRDTQIDANPRAIQQYP